MPPGATAGSDWPARWVRERLGYELRDAALFTAALTHRSAARPHNERLEFLGDAVLNLLIAEHLYRVFPAADEGDLSRLRAWLVSSQPLAGIAAELGLGEVLHLGSGELKSGGFRRESILADALEAVVGAVYLDGGPAAAQAVVFALFGGRLARLPDPEELKDPKTRLQEYLQSRGLPLPGYEVVRTAGEIHAQTFWVRCEAATLGRTAVGEGLSRRRAEQEAAAAVLAQMGVAAGRNAGPGSAGSGTGRDAGPGPGSAGVGTGRDAGQGGCGAGTGVGTAAAAGTARPASPAKDEVRND